MIKPAMVSAVSILVLAGFVGYAHMYQPAQRTQRQLQDQLNLEHETQALKEGIINGLDEIERLRSRLPSKPETEWLLKTVGDIAKAEGVQLDLVALEEPKRLEDAAHLSVSLSFHASYHQLGRFISALENSPKFLWIETMEVSRHQATGAAEVTLTVSSMWVPPFAVSP